MRLEWAIAGFLIWGIFSFLSLSGGQGEFVDNGPTEHAAPHPPGCGSFC